MSDTVLRSRLLVSISFLACAAVCFTGGSADACGDGGDWIEEGEAPDGATIHQQTRCCGSAEYVEDCCQGGLLRISGSLNPSAADRVDAYVIKVTDPTTFYATSGLNKRLYLFTKNKQPLLGHEDSEHGPTIADPDFFTVHTGHAVSAEASAIELVAGETYLLAITSSDVDPHDALHNNMIELLGEDSELAGPSPAVGNLDHWETVLNQAAGPTEEGDDFYSIDLQGANFSVIMIDPNTYGDFNADGNVDAADYVVWRKNPGGTFTDFEYETWRTNFGQTGPSGAGGSVPEPAGITMLVSAILIAVPGSMRRRWHAA